MTRQVDKATGSIRIPGYPAYNLDQSLPQVSETLTEDYGKGDNLAFSVYRRTAKNFVLNGHYAPSPTSAFQMQITNWLLCGQVSSINWDIGTVISQSDGWYATKLLADTNPSTPTVDIPAFIGELKDFPELFKIAGGSLLRKAASANLNFHFGWKPLISDLSKIIDFSSVVNKRYKELKKLYNGGLSRTRNLDNISGSEVNLGDFAALNHASATVFCRHKAVTTQKVWGHCKWKPTSLPPKTDEDYLNLARRAAYGLTIDPASAWELIPFSWLADWVVNVGNYLNAHRNLVGAVPSDISIMRHTQTTHSCMRYAGSVEGDFNTGTVLTETKTRNPSSATLSAGIRWLSPRDLSILGSLWVMKNSGQIRRL
jgi:hypothetical protein